MWYLEVITWNETKHHILAAAMFLGYLCQDPCVGTCVFIIFMGEFTYPLFVFQSTLELINYPQESFLYHIAQWLHYGIFLIARPFICIYTDYVWIPDPRVSFFIVLITTPNIMLSMTWCVMMCGKLWKSIPQWFTRSEKITKADWWIAGRDFTNKLQKDKLYKTTLDTVIILATAVVPLSYSVYVRL